MQNKPGIFVLLLIAFVCARPSFAAESHTQVQSTEQRAEQALMLQLDIQPNISKFDCSHLVHVLYERVGLHYQYANSHALYRGIEEFERVLKPNSGDLVVWRGHAGIVVDPSQHSFLSALKTGVKISSYVSTYWRRLGSPRFFRFAFSTKNTNELEPADKPESASVPSASSGDN